MWFLHPVGRGTEGVAARAAARARERDREQERARNLERSRQGRPRPVLVPLDPLPVPEPQFSRPSDSRVVLLDKGAMLRHTGRRQDRVSPERITRGEREQAVLHMLGTFRVATRRNILEYCFDGHPFVANRVLADQLRKGVVRKRKVAHGKHGYDVYTLSGAGRDLLARLREQLDGEESAGGSQRYWADAGDDRQLRHDHHVFDAVSRDSSDVLQRGGRVVRVRLESELRGRLAAADHAGRRAGGPASARDARRREARRLGLPVFVSGVSLPDALVELEEPDGRRVLRAVEVASGHYTNKQIKEKREAGFRVYGMPQFRSGGERRRRGTLGKDEFFPLSWGR